MINQDFSGFSMLDLFRMEVETQLVLFNENLLLIENQIDGDFITLSKPLEALMRAAHSIKGAAKIVGLERVVEIAHRMENCFVAAQKGELKFTDRHIDILLDAVDWLTHFQQLTTAELPVWLETQGAAVTHLTEQLDSLMAPVPSPPAIAPTAATTVTPEPTPAPAPPSTTTPSPTTTTESAIAEVVTQADNAKTDIAEVVAQADNTKISEPSNRVLRVSTENLNQIMALAGESVVESHWLQRFADSTLHVRRQQQEMIRQLDQLQQQIGLDAQLQDQISNARKIALDAYSLLSDRLTELDQFSRRFNQLSDNLYREVIASHMRPFADGVQAFPRMVRDVAKDLGKKVNLEIVGLMTKVDRDILEKLEAPLTHMLRNAIAHGIESPATRIAAGKPETGKLILTAKHHSGMLTISLSDDGRGINLEELRQKVVEKQLTSSELALQLSDAELLEFLFLPGFSTTNEVTELSGRGVGLDIAQTMVQSVGGLLRVQTKLGEGTKFHYQLPLTLSVVKALLVKIGGEAYAFNLNRIERVLMVDPQAIATTESHPYIVVDDENISLVKAHEILELPATTKDTQGQIPVILLSDHTHRYAVVVDQFLGERDLVVRPLDPRLGKVQDIAAAAIAEDGQPILIVDVADMVRTVDQLISGGNFNRLQQKITVDVETKPKRVLVVDDSITVREMERKLLQNHGYQVDVAVNGMEGWNSVRAGDYDLVISDIDMPRMNGIELVQHIKGHPQLKAIPIIIVSYKDRQEDQLAGLEAGADYYLTKSSFHDNSLVNAVMDLIGTA